LNWFRAFNLAPNPDLKLAIKTQILASKHFKRKTTYPNKCVLANPKNCPQPNAMAVNREDQVLASKVFLVISGDLKRGYIFWAKKKPRFRGIGET